MIRIRPIKDRICKPGLETVGNVKSKGSMVREGGKVAKRRQYQLKNKDKLSIGGREKVGLNERQLKVKQRKAIMDSRIK